MPIWLPVFLMMIVVSLLMGSSVPIGEEGSIVPDEAAQVTPAQAGAGLDFAVARNASPSMALYHQAAIVYAIANPGASGQLATASLAFPSGVQPGPWIARIDGGNTVTTYPAQASASPFFRGPLAAALHSDLIDTNALSMGVANGTSVVMGNGTTQTLPGGISLPTGTPILSTRIR